VNYFKVLEFWIGQKQPEAGMLIGMIIFFRVPEHQ